MFVHCALSNMLPPVYCIVDESIQAGPQIQADDLMQLYQYVWGLGFMVFVVMSIFCLWMTLLHLSFSSYCT